MEKERSIHLQGVAAAHGIGIGPAWVHHEKKVAIRPKKISKENISDHIEKYLKAIEALEKEFEVIKNHAEGDASDIIEAQIQTLNDPELHKLIKGKIESELYDVAYAIFSTFNEYIRLMENSGINWAEERTIDLVTIRDQLVAHIRNEKETIDVADGSIVFAENLSPTMMVELSRLNISGIVMQKGGLTSHAVILSQSLGIPCVIGLKWNHLNISEGVNTALDGEEGSVIIRPSQHEIDILKEKKSELEKASVRELESVDKPHKTKCGSSFTLRANIEFLAELPRINRVGAKGVGLLRTETMLFQNKDFNVEDQVAFYTEVLEYSGDEEVTIRLFDAGGDKLLDNSEEANPFLGWRGIRLLLDERDLLDNQLEAICVTAARHKGRVNILVPMISSIEEILEVKNIFEEKKRELSARGVEVDNDIKFGIMIEVPGIAIMADEAAKHVDFFSIGTNDLTQYTLAVDRGNEKISHLYEPLHPSVWKLIKMTKSGADNAGIPVSVCGEMASNPAAAACLVGMGINELSMTTSAVPAVKTTLCSNNLSTMETLSEQVLSSLSGKEVKKIFRDYVGASIQD